MKINKYLKISKLWTSLLVVIANLVSSPKSIGRLRFCDVSFGYRMGAGFPGDVTRSHPASIEPCLNNPTTPLLRYGYFGLITNGDLRPIASGDQSDTEDAVAYGVTVRPFPQQASVGDSAFGGAAFGAGVPPANAAIDMLRSGYIIVKVNGSPVKGDPVFVWAAADTGNHVLGQPEAAFTTVKTVKIAGATYNGSPDANGYVEIAFNV
jgi:hypothetical protein